jgi:MFS transporter, DHA1 family, multidrug resistance protein
MPWKWRGSSPSLHSGQLAVCALASQAITEAARERRLVQVSPATLNRMPLTTHAHRRMSPAVVVMMLTLLLGIQPVTTDLYLPALPTLMLALHTHVAAAQLTLSVLIICFGVAQLACGPLADKYGRKPVLLWGMAAYTVASVFSALAPSIEWLVACRALQGAAMAAAVTCGRSMVRDLFVPQEGARVMSRALSGLGAIAAVSPLLGGWLVQALNWHAVLLVLALYGAGTLAYIAWRFEETVPALNPSATQFQPLLRNWRHVLSHPTFRAWTALISFSYGGVFLFLASSSFVYIDVLGLSRLGYGAAVASNSVAYITGTWLCRRLLLQRGVKRTVWLGGFVTLSGGLGMAALSLAGVHTVWALLIPQWLFALGHGIHQPCGQACAIGPFPDKAGTAASLSGFIVMVVAFAVSLWLGHALNGTVYPLTLGMAAFSIGVAAVAWTFIQRHGEPLATTSSLHPQAT